MTKLEKTILEGIEVLEKKYPQYLGKEAMLNFLIGYCSRVMNEKVKKALDEKYFNYPVK